MKLDIRTVNMQWSDALAGHIERRIHARLSHLGDRVRCVLVRLVDVNGPKGGEDKHCFVAVRLSSGREIVTNGLDGCAYRAVNGAVQRMKRTVADHTGRKRARRRRRAA